MFQLLVAFFNFAKLQVKQSCFPFVLTFADLANLAKNIYIFLQHLIFFGKIGDAGLEDVLPLFQGIDVESWAVACWL